jgi:alpha-L-arabinofuranosidase
MAENKPTYNLKTVIIPRAVGTSEPKDGISLADSVRQFSVAGYDETTGEIIVKVVNAEEKPWHATISINSGGTISRHGKVVTLKADSLKEENSFEEPLKIFPVTTEYDAFLNEFDYEFEPCSLTILRIGNKTER